MVQKWLATRATCLDAMAMTRNQGRLFVSLYHKMHNQKTTISTMNQDLTFNTIAFKKSYDKDGESLRQSTTRSINTPDRLTIRSQDYVDSATKVTGTRYTGRVDRVDIDANLQEIQTSMYFVIAVPKTAAQASVDNVVATFKAVVADATFVPAVLNNEK